MFQASNFLRRLREEDDESVIHSKLELLNRAGILDNMPLSVLFDREEITEQWRDAVGHIQNTLSPNTMLSVLIFLVEIGLGLKLCPPNMP